MNAQVTLPEQLLSSLSSTLNAQMGLHFPQERWRDLERGIAAAAPEFGFGNLETCVHSLLTGPLSRTQIEILASHLTVGETYFFRDKRTFEVLEEHILPGLIGARRGAEQRLRIWSTACCTGEEPYSIAILLDRLLPETEQWNVTILATDINPRFLRRAAEGVYGNWSFRETPVWIRERYFTAKGEARFEVKPEIKKMVNFSYLNLAEDVYPSLLNSTNAMDIVFCRNVLMYFSPERAAEVVAKLRRSLVDGGWLIVSPTESSIVAFSAFNPVEFPGAIVHRKTASAAPRFAAARRMPALDEKPALLHPEAPFAPPDPVPVPGARPPSPPEAPPGTKAAGDAAPREIRLHDQAAGEAPSQTARNHANQGRLAEAIEWCEKAIAGDKLNPAHYYLLATVQQERGQGQAAEQSLGRALYLEPDFVLAHFALGNACLAQGRRREADRHFENALALLRTRPQDEAVPHGEGLTAGRLAEIIESVRLSQPRPATAGA